MNRNENNSTFDCVVIGGTTLLIRCAEILSDRGHRIKGLFSSDPLIVRWGLEKGIDVFDPASIEKFFEENSVDYLFSVVNERILSSKILASPRRLAINYHDAPLPRYAGTHATSWALLNREREHGVSWHIA
ncbi:MAG TPA: formyltransferase family protein, partial [Pyrinomonadaceae bacterium]